MFIEENNKHHLLSKQNLKKIMSKIKIIIDK